MYDKVHEMRSRIITSPSFSGEKVIGAILFENTMDREIEGMPTCKFLWEKKNVVPFLKVDKGLDDEVDGVQLMKQIPGLDELLKRAKEAGVFGTKMRSVIQSANEEGITAIVDQQFTVGKQIIAAGLIPILEPEGMTLRLLYAEPPRCCRCQLNAPLFTLFPPQSTSAAPQNQSAKIC